MNIHISDTIDSIVWRNLKAAKVLSKHGIDYFSEGNKSLTEACREANIPFPKLVREINAVESYRCDLRNDVYDLEIDELTRFIEKYHHLYTYETVIFIKNNIARLIQTHGSSHPELEEVNKVFLEMTTHLTVHMGHEEHILFPYIRQMVRRGRKVRSSFFKSVASPINTMVMDHGTEDECLRKLDDLTHHYSPPVGGCTAFRVTYQALEELEKDLHMHIRLENEILFPKALEMESNFNMRPYRQN